MALLAPVLGAARIARAVRRGTVESEFDRWFQAVERGVDPSHARAPIFTHLPLERRAAGVESRM